MINGEAQHGFTNGKIYWFKWSEKVRVNITCFKENDFINLKYEIEALMQNPCWHAWYDTS